MGSTIFSATFEPILLPNETALLLGPAHPTEGQAIKCRWVGALPEYQKDFSTLTAATWKTDQEDTNLELGTLELGQMRFRILEDMQVRLGNPAATHQWRTARTRFHITKWPTESGQDFLKEMLFRMSEFFVWENNTPRFDLYSLVGQTAARIVFSGWKLKVEKIAKTELTSKVEIWTSGWPTGK